MGRLWTGSGWMDLKLQLSMREGAAALASGPYFYPTGYYSPDQHFGFFWGGATHLFTDVTKFRPVPMLDHRHLSPPPPSPCTCRNVLGAGVGIKKSYAGITGFCPPRNSGQQPPTRHVERRRRSHGGWVLI